MNIYEGAELPIEKSQFCLYFKPQRGAHFAITTGHLTIDATEPQQAVNIIGYCFCHSVNIPSV